MNQNILYMVFFVSGGDTMRRPYVSSSNYILKMSDYKKHKNKYKKISIIQWLPDSRGEKADRSNEDNYPCIKCVSTIDAPFSPSNRSASV